MIADSTNATAEGIKGTIETIHDVANGDLTWVDVIMGLEMHCDNDIVVPALQGLVLNVSNSVTRLMNAVIARALEVRANEEQYQGSWRKLVAGINTNS